jgi:hypothetical protein
MSKYAQVWNPKTKEWVKIDLTIGMIVDRSKEGWGLPVLKRVKKGVKKVTPKFPDGRILKRNISEARE